MDSCSDIDVDMYDVIFKTIYLFLESNEFHDTATSFLAEIRRKFDKEVDTTSSNAKTLILRPYFESADGATGQNDENLENVRVVSHAETIKDSNIENNVITSEDNESSTPELNLMEEKTSEIMMQVLSPKLSQPNILQSLCINNDNTGKKSHNSQEILHKSWENLFEQYKNSVCPDCTNITRIKQELDRLSSSSAIMDPNDTNILHQSFKLLQELQENHVKLIHLGHAISSAICTLTNEPRNLLLSRFHQPIYDFYSYPGTHCSNDVRVILQDGDRMQNHEDDNNTDSIFKLNLLDIEDRTEYQVESSVINSSKESNFKLNNDLFIPLENKPVVGNIAALIDPQDSQEVNDECENNILYQLHCNLMAESSESSELSKMSDVSNDDADRRSPSRFGSDFILKPPEPFRNDVSNKTSSHRMNKSATMLAVNVTPPVGRKKSHSASFVQKNQEKLLLSPNYRSKTRENEDKTQNKKSIEVKIATPKETTRKRTPAKRSDKQPDEQEDVTLNYQALIKEKTKLILDKQKTQLKDEQKSSAHAQKIKSPNLPKILPESVTMRAFEVQNDDSLQTDSSELDTSEFITKFREDFMQNVVITQNQLNWCALKRALYEDTPEVKMKLLQALRWRLTDCNSSQREAQLLEYVKNDILSINSIPPHGQLFLESFYCPKKMVTPHPLQEEMARFINTLASLSMGRLYLERDESLLSVMLLPLLMGKLPGIKIYDLTREFTMATVQKLSLSNKMREVMINAGVMEWLILFIEKNHHKMTTYEAEYSIALLTNLCINKEARSRCERVADRVVTVIDDLIDTPHKCCLPYINPILYSLLLNPVINDRAVSNGIGVKLKQLYNVYENNIELTKQLDAIIAMHEARDFCECDDADTEDVTNQNHADYLEQELSLRDPIYHTPMGEELLKLFYTRTEPSSGRFLNLDNEVRHPSLVQIVKKSCVCNNKSLSRLEQRLLSEENVQNPIEAVKINKWQNRPTYRKRTDTPIPNRNNHNHNSKSLTNKIPNKTSNNNKLIKGRNEVKLGARQRSTSQPPARKHKPISTKTENLKKTERIKMIPMNDANKSPNDEINTENPTPKQYILNCCLKMDYMNAIAAPPGEYRPQPLHTSSPNLNSHTDDNYVDFKKNCKCYNEMQQFIGDYSPKGKKTNAKMSPGGSEKGRLRRSPPSLFRRRSTDAYPVKITNKNSAPLFDVKDIRDEDVQVNYFDSEMMMVRTKTRASNKR